MYTHRHNGARPVRSRIPPRRRQPPPSIPSFPTRKETSKRLPPPPHASCTVPTSYPNASMSLSRTLTCAATWPPEATRVTSRPSPLAGNSGSANSAGIPVSHEVNCLSSEEERGRNRRTLSVCLPRLFVKMR
jgi:hypothetical protein